MGKKELSILFILLSISIQVSYQLNEKGCMIDQCKSCDFTNVYTCNQCKGGYYLRTFFGDEKRVSYHDCWSKAKLRWAILGLVALALTQCCCIYYCYRRALTIVRIPRAQEQEVVNDTRGNNEVRDTPVLVGSRQRENQPSSLSIDQHHNNANPHFNKLTAPGLETYNEPGDAYAGYYKQKPRSQILAKSNKRAGSLYFDRRRRSYRRHSSKNKSGKRHNSSSPYPRRKLDNNKIKIKRKRRSRRSRSRSRSRNRGKNPKYYR